ncbi:hypothetical protein M422DRAFT_64843 [Sphaerobolus stellatus SS14]|uniref:Unplaced genomic scaffold SPHSTscaffold_131, whole genome shotgun sequence n=1 Tax=Sphaerobolus stellatus (strain SS14) TaxID=990650 RepID=A0A0C9UXG1_SPHS4|nr:hypothetical protein M422DRAFT_70326 [Sphaerobolus stellatus SS14]KIJ52964.1 hypothetical protein M422DRAFT_64843 [Sphaerobolus stellatus SS14]
MVFNFVPPNAFSPAHLNALGIQLHSVAAFPPGTLLVPSLYTPQFLNPLGIQWDDNLPGIGVPHATPMEIAETLDKFPSQQDDPIGEDVISMGIPPHPTVLPGSQTLDGVNVPRTYESTLDGNHPELSTSEDLNDNIGEGHEQEMPVNIDFTADFRATAQNPIAGRLIRNDRPASSSTQGGRNTSAAHDYGAAEGAAIHADHTLADHQMMGVHPNPPTHSIPHVQSKIYPIPSHPERELQASNLRSPGTGNPYLERYLPPSEQVILTRKSVSNDQLEIPATQEGAKQGRKRTEKKPRKKWTLDNLQAQKHRRLAAGRKFFKGRREQAISHENATNAHTHPRGTKPTPKEGRKKRLLRPRKRCIGSSVQDKQHGHKEFKFGAKRERKLALRRLKSSIAKRVDDLQTY